MKNIANSARLAWRYLWARPLASALNLLLLTLGLAAITMVLLVRAQIDRAFERDLAGIDVVVGAKGSPLQLILAGVFHLDVPPGNVALADVQALAAHPQVARLIPLSVGDSYRGFRIVGTTPDYLAHYGIAAHPDDLKQHHCIFYRGGMGRLDWRFISGSQEIISMPTGHLSLNDTSATLVAARSGAGLARLPAYLAQPDLEAGRLVEVLADWPQPVLPLSIVFAPGRRSEAKIKAFIDFMVAEINI